jgi:Zn-dependent protease
VVLGGLLLKFKAAIFVIFKIKLLATSASMLVSIGAYGLLWGWKFGVGFVALLLIHELGHVIEAKRQGLPVHGVYFVPFLGAVMLAKAGSKDAAKGAWLGLAGPLLGSAAAFACWGIGLAYDSDFFVALAFIGFFLNLFNLIPIHPLDGGYAAAVFHPLFWVFGLVGVVAMMFVWPSPILILIAAMGAHSVWQRWKLRDHPGHQAYYDVAANQRVSIAAVYLGLAAVLAISLSATHRKRTIESVTNQQNSALVGAPGVGRQPAPVPHPG